MKNIGKLKIYTGESVCMLGIKQYIKCNGYNKNKINSDQEMIIISKIKNI